MMTLFAPDLYRNFAFGFVAGALMVGAAAIGDGTPRLASPALAAEPAPAPEISSEFVIEPLEFE